MLQWLHYFGFINKDSVHKAEHAGSMINADQCRSMADQISSIDPKYRSIKINVDQCRSMLTNASLISIGHHCDLIRIDRHWSTLIGIGGKWSLSMPINADQYGSNYNGGQWRSRRHWSALISIDRHWSLLICILDQCWKFDLALIGIDHWSSMSCNLKVNVASRS